MRQPTEDLKVLVPFVNGLERYLQIMFRACPDFILSTLVKTGTTVQSLKYEEFEWQPFPIPPLAEQRRIVAKVDELMALCGRLEEQLTSAQTESSRLLEAVLHNALTGRRQSGARFPHEEHMGGLVTMMAYQLTNARMAEGKAFAWRKDLQTERPTMRRGFVLRRENCCNNHLRRLSRSAFYLDHDIGLGLHGAKITLGTWLKEKRRAGPANS